MARLNAFKDYQLRLNQVSQSGSSILEALVSAAVLAISIAGFARLYQTQSSTHSKLQNKAALIEHLHTLTSETSDWDSLLWSSNRTAANRGSLKPCIDRDTATTCEAKMSFFHVYQAGQTDQILSGDLREKVALFDKNLRSCSGQKCTILSLSLLHARCEREGRRCHDAQTIEIRHYVFNLMSRNISVEAIAEVLKNKAKPKEIMALLKKYSYADSTVHIDRGFMNSWKRLANAYCPEGEALRGLNYDYTPSCIEIPKN